MPLPQLASFAGNFCTRRKATSDARQRVILRSLAHGRRNPARSALPAKRMKCRCRNWPASPATSALAGRRPPTLASESSCARSRTVAGIRLVRRSRRSEGNAAAATGQLRRQLLHSPEGDLRRSPASHLALARARSPESGSFGAPGEAKEMPLPQLASFAGNFCTRRKATSDARQRVILRSLAHGRRNPARSALPAKRRKCRCRNWPCDLYLPANGSGVKVYFVDRYS